MAGNTYFGPELFEFLLELRFNNDRDWFRANKGRYEKVVRDPLVAFVSDFGGPLRKISPHYVADPRPTGGSIFRIYRDVRFSPDKSPYKTQAALHFRHESYKDAHAPGFYLHLEPDNVFAAGGIWHPDAQSLGMIRNAIVANPSRWQNIISDKALVAAHRMEGDSLKRPPKGYDPGHPLIGELKRKDFITARTLSQQDAYGAKFMDRFADSCRTNAAYMEFLTAALVLICVSI